MILPIEKQVCTFEQAKQLKELGLRIGATKFVYTIEGFLFEYKHYCESSFGFAPALGSTEAGIILFKDINKVKVKWNRKFRVDFNIFINENEYVENHTFDTEAQGRSELVIYKAKHKQIDLSKF